jgi:hypothetical protein
MQSNTKATHKGRKRRKGNSRFMFMGRHCAPPNVHTAGVAPRKKHLEA